jgi:hypothetical protein
VKNLYLPGTNKNIGYIDKSNTMSIYKRYKQYLPLPIGSGNLPYGIFYICEIRKSGFIVLQKTGDNEKYLEFKSHCGYIYNVDTNMYDFYNCAFETPDNLDVIEKSYLYKHWSDKDA